MPFFLKAIVFFEIFKAISFYILLTFQISVVLKLVILKYFKNIALIPTINIHISRSHS